MAGHRTETDAAMIGRSANGSAGYDLGVFLDGTEPAARIAETARVAEANGCRTLWFANHLFHRDPVVQASATLSATKRICATLTAISPYTIHPVQAAMAAATLDEHFPGRIALSFGAGAPGDMDAAGVDRAKPLATLRESVELARSLLAGETVDHDGERFRVHGRSLENAPRSVPVMLAASGEKMLEQGGRIADGVILSAATSTPFVRWCLDKVSEGAAGRPVRHVGLVFVSVDMDEGRAYDRLRHNLAYILRGSHHSRNLEMAGVSLDQEAVYAAVAAGDWDRAEALITDDVVASQTASGTPAQVRARLGEYAAAGLDEIVVGGLSEPEEIEKSLTAIARAD